MENKEASEAREQKKTSSRAKSPNKSSSKKALQTPPAPPVSSQEEVADTPSPVGLLSRIKKSFSKPQPPYEEQLLEQLEHEPETAASSTSSTPADERLKAQVAALSDSRTATNERLTHLAEEMGSLREALRASERETQALEAKSAKAIGLVEAVQPQELLSQVKRLEAELAKRDARIESLKALSDKVIEDVKSFKSTISAFRGVEQVIALSTDAKDALRSVERIEQNSKRHADTVENIFADFSTKYKKFLEFSELAETMRQTQKRSEQVLSDVQKRVDLLASASALEAVEKEANELGEVIMSDVSAVKEEIGVVMGLIHKFEEQHIESHDVRITALEARMSASSSLDASSVKKDIDAVLKKSLSAVEQLRADVSTAISAQTPQNPSSDALSALTARLNVLSSRCAALERDAILQKKAAESALQNSSSFSASEKDLISQLAAYIGAHLSSYEDAAVHQFLSTHGHKSEHIAAALRVARQ